MRLHFALFGVFFLFLEIAWSQATYKPGFVIELNQDTTKGFLLYKVNSTRFEFCSFKPSETAEPVQYSPKQILGYGFINDSYYESKEITINEETQTVFAEILVSGRASLLTRNGEFYLEDFEKKIYILEIREVEINNENGNFIQKKELFKGVLAWRFMDCPKASSRIKTVNLEVRSLVNLFEFYNSCFGDSPSNKPQISYKSSKPWFQMYLGLSGGVSSSSFTNLQTVPIAYFVNEEQFNKDKSLMGGVSMAFSSPRTSEQFSMNLEILYQKGTNESLQKKNASVYNTVILEYTTIQVPVSVSYTFNKKLKPSIEIGLNSSLVIDQSSYFQQDVTFGNTVTTEIHHDVIGTNRIYAAAFVGAGLRKDLNAAVRVFIRGRYQYGLASIIDSGISGFILSTGVLYKIK